MTLVNSGPYLMRIILTWLIFYYVLNLIYQPDTISLQRKSITMISLYFVSVILNIFLHGYSYLPILLLIYGSFQTGRNVNYYLLNTTLLSFLLKFLSVIIPTRLLAPFFTPAEIHSYYFILVILFFQFLGSFLFIYFYKFCDLDKHFKYQDSAMTSVLLGYLYIVLYATMLFVRQFRTYINLVTGILVFVLIQCAFIIFIFIRQRHLRDRVYQDKFSEEQVKNLKIYTDQLEKDQLKLRHFKHDYKNLLFSLKTVADEEDYVAMNQALDNLENYSDDYLNNLSMELYKDLNNVKNPYLKSLFINKMNVISQNNITCHFHCRKELTDVPINILDLIKLLNQAIDNAIEYTKSQEHGEIQLAITQENQRLAFIINSTVSKVPTTKRETDGFELLHIKDLKKKYSNIFIQYSKNTKWFRFHITLITKGA